MNVRSRSLSAVLTVCALLVTTEAAEARGAHPHSSGFNIGPSAGNVVGVVVGFAAVGAAIGVDVYFAGRHDHRLTGCAAIGPDGLQLVSERDKQTYSLVGNVAGVTPGDRVRVSGKRNKHGTSQTFLVEKVSRDFGACKV
jgi:hypothetical protein